MYVFCSILMHILSIVRIKVHGSIPVVSLCSSQLCGRVIEQELYSMFVILFPPFLLPFCRDCVGRTFELPIGPVRQCSTQCSSQTLCVAVQVPEEHLKVCDAAWL